jgi:prepilin-type N-terminal cleavage/methylation domain-containing protein
MIKKYDEGFTLIEIIVAIVVLAIAAAMMVPFFGKALTQSPAPIANLQQSTSLQAVMENIISDSDSFLFPPVTGRKSGPTNCTDLGTLQGRINTNNPRYGTYTVIQNGFINNTTLVGPPSNTCDLTHNILQVTVSDTTGETLTSLFTIFITAG